MSVVLVGPVDGWGLGSYVGSNLGAVGAVSRRLSENIARSEGCEKLRIKISASEENSAAI